MSARRPARGQDTRNPRFVTAAEAGEELPGGRADSVAAQVGVQRLVLEDFHPAQLLNNSHVHWSVQRERRRIAMLRTVTMARFKLLRPMVGRVKVQAVYVYPRHYRVDPDGLASRLKGVLDGLVQAGVLADDSMDHIDLEVSMRVEKGRKALEITLEPATRPATPPAEEGR